MMKNYVILLMLIIAVQGWSCGKNGVFPGPDDTQSVDISGHVVSYTDQQPIPNISLIQRRCEMFSDACYEGGVLGVTNNEGYFKFRAELYLMSYNYLKLGNIDSTYESYGYVNGHFVHSLETVGFRLDAPSAGKIDSDTFRIELVKR